MSKEQFCYWLQGILDSNENLSRGQIDMIREKLNSSMSQYTYTVPANGWLQPTTVEPYKVTYTQSTGELS